MWIVVLIAMIVGWAVLFAVSEFNVIRRGHESFKWAQWVWDNVEWIRKVRW